MHNSKGYKPLEDYGLIGNCRSCALVSNEGSIDWACLPNFDSSAYFCKILDKDKGGYFQISPTGFFKTHQQYLDKTNLLETIFFSHEKKLSVTDFMPISQENNDLLNIPEFGTKIVRLVKAVRGDHNVQVKLKVTPNFAKDKAEVVHKEGLVIFQDNEYQIVLYKKHHNVEIKKDMVIISFNLKEGEQEFFALSFLKKNQNVKPFTKQSVNARLAEYYFESIDFWRNWAGICEYKGEYYDQVIRSALTLKLLTYLPTGAIVAAPTTSLPEKLGGEFNWDYRYTWLRDASFTVYAFLGLGYIDEASHFMSWLEKVCLSEDSRLRIMYGINGEKELKEYELDHLAGYMNSSPVRIGNEASDQKQFDIFGEVLTAINLYVSSGGKVSPEFHKVIVRLVNYCCTHWQETDHGIWEPRYGERHNVYSKVMCWVGVDRGIKLAKKLKIKNVDTGYWEKTRDKIRKDVLLNGYNEKK